MNSVLRLLHRGWKELDGREISAPFSPAQLAVSPLGPPTCFEKSSEDSAWLEALFPNLPSPLYLAGDTTSSLDLAHALAEAGALPEWGSVITLTQSRGRGQLRRNWISPQGNMYAAVRLPMEGVFSSDAAALAVGVLLVSGLEKAGAEVFLKWPNDIIQISTGTGIRSSEKIGGILLEERNGTLLAGIGINVASAPEASRLRESHAVPAGTLRFPPLHPLQTPSDKSLGQVFTLWALLVEHIFFCYKQKISSAGTASDNEDWWFDMASARLAFRQEPVRLVDAQSAEGEEIPHLIDGLLEGINRDGALCLITNQGRKIFIGGSLVPMRGAGTKR